VYDYWEDNCIGRLRRSSVYDYWEDNCIGRLRRSSVYDYWEDNYIGQLRRSSVYDYWEDNYIGRLRRRRRAAPTFPIALWNMRSRVTDGLPRTNNSVEGWHHAFQSSFACHHPNIYKLIEQH